MLKLNEYKLEDLYGMSSGLSSSKNQAGHGYPFVTFKTVFDNYFLPDEISDLMDTSQEERESLCIKKDDILLTRTSETSDELAMSCVALKDYPNTTFSGFLKRLRPKTDGIAYGKYMAFYLRSPYFRNVIINNTTMTLRASFNEDIFSFIKVYLPSFKDQKKIGDFLFLLDSKITYNKQINDNLENIMHLIYENIIQRGAVKEIDGILTTAKNIASVTTGKEDAHFASENGRYMFFTCSKNPLRCNSYCFDSSSILIAGNGDFNVKHYSGKFNAYQRTYVLTPPKEYYAILYLAAIYRINSFKLQSTGSIVKFITKADIENIPIFIPNDHTYLFALDKLIFLQEQCNQEIDQLNKVKNWLLPLLLNGQLSVKT